MNPRKPLPIRLGVWGFFLNLHWNKGSIPNRKPRIFFTLLLYCPQVTVCVVYKFIFLWNRHSYVLRSFFFLFPICSAQKRFSDFLTELLIHVLDNADRIKGCCVVNFCVYQDVWKMTWVLDCSTIIKSLECEVINITFGSFSHRTFAWSSVWRQIPLCLYWGHLLWNRVEFELLCNSRVLNWKLNHLQVGILNFK